MSDEKPGIINFFAAVTVVMAAILGIDHLVAKLTGQKREKTPTPRSYTTPHRSIYSSSLPISGITYRLSDFRNINDMPVVRQRIEQDTIKACSRNYQGTASINPMTCRIQFSTIMPHERGESRQEILRSASGIAEVTCSRNANRRSSCTLNGLRFRG